MSRPSVTLHQLHIAPWQYHKYALYCKSQRDINPFKTYSPGMTLKAPHKLTQTHTMTRTLALGMLAQGNTGSEILEILNVLSEDSSDNSGASFSQVSPTLLEIQFWFPSDAYCAPCAWHIGGICARLTVSLSDSDFLLFLLVWCLPSDGSKVDGWPPPPTRKERSLQPTKVYSSETYRSLFFCAWEVSLYNSKNRNKDMKKMGHNTLKMNLCTKI